MATHPETQAYLDEAKTPSIVPLIGSGSLAAGSKAFAKRAGEAMQQIARLEAALQMSEIVEDNDELSALYEMQTQRLAAMRRSLEEHHRAARALRLQLRDFHVDDALMRVKALAAGYTV